MSRVPLRDQRTAAIDPGDRVAFLAPNIPELLIAHFAVPLARGVLVAINSRLSITEIEYILDHSGARLLFADAELLDTVVRLGESSTNLNIIAVRTHELGVERAQQITASYEDYTEFLLGGKALEQSALSWSVADERTPISINYTSGTTGRPKGAVYTHRGAYLNSLGEVIHQQITGSSNFLWTLPMFHCKGWCMPWAITSVAATHVTMRAVRGSSVWEAIDTLGITHLCAAPTVCSLIVDAPEAHPLNSPLRVTTAGAPPSPTIIGALERLGITVVHVYGLTEVYGPFTVCEPQSEWLEQPTQARAALLSRQGVGMLQAESARVVNVGGADVPRDGTSLGEIVLRGNNVMLGYFRDPLGTRKAFDGGWFHTGDLGVMHGDGYIEIRDRAKDIIISGGENISTIEVEQTIVSHPAVSEAAVVGVAHTKWGERPIAYVVLREARALSENELREFLINRVARFKVPDRFTFVVTLPHTATGKVKKFELKTEGDEVTPAAQS